MTELSIAERLKRKFLLFSNDEATIQAIAATLPEQWSMVAINDLEAMGDWHEVLLHRFVLLDLDEIDSFDPLDIIRTIRMKYMINTPVFCFGGDQDIQDEMRIARADRFFSREELPNRMAGFYTSLGW